MSARTQSTGLLLEEILAAQESKATSKCTVRTILESVAPTDAEDIRTALGMSNITSTTLTDILKRRGFKLSSHTVQRHRRGDCSCEVGDCS